MNDGTTISTFQLFQMFPDADSARLAIAEELLADCADALLTDSAKAQRAHAYLALREKEQGR